ncbi:hypothetical protein D3C71_1287810 [compost metagenome]
MGPLLRRRRHHRPAGQRWPAAREAGGVLRRPSLLRGWRLHPQAAVLRHDELRCDAGYDLDGGRDVPAVQGPPLLRPACLYRWTVAGRAAFDQPGSELEPHHRGNHRVFRGCGASPVERRPHQGQRSLPRAGRAQPRIRLVRLRGGPGDGRHLPGELEVPQPLENLWPGRIRGHAVRGPGAQA